MLLPIIRTIALPRWTWPTSDLWDYRLSHSRPSGFHNGVFNARLSLRKSVYIAEYRSDQRRCALSLSSSS